MMTIPEIIGHIEGLEASVSMLMKQNDFLNHNIQGLRVQLGVEQPPEATDLAMAKNVGASLGRLPR